MGASIRLEIQRQTGLDVRAVRSEDSIGVADGKCPGCDAEPFVVLGSGRHRISRDTYRADGYARCCGDPVGYIFAKTDTLFGLEEDDIILNGRARVY